MVRRCEKDGGDVGKGGGRVDSDVMDEREGGRNLANGEAGEPEEG